MKKETEKKGKIERFYDGYLSKKHIQIIILLAFFAIYISVLTPIAKLIVEAYEYMVADGVDIATKILVTILSILIAFVGGTFIACLIAAILFFMFEFTLQQLVNIERRYILKKSENTKSVSKKENS